MNESNENLNKSNENLEKNNKNEIMQSKKMALLLFGISYDSNYINGKVRKHYLVDARQYFKNLNEIVITYFKNGGYEIDLFLTTNKNSIENELLEIYQPKAWIFDESNSRRNKKIKNGLEMIINNNSKDLYDLILITRFDLFFQKKFCNTFFDIDKLNIVSILEKQHLIDDNFYLFPNKYLLNFYKIFSDCRDHYKEEAHNLKNIFHQKFDIHYINNEYTTVENLSFFKLRYFNNIDFIMNGKNYNKFIKNITNNVYYFSKSNSSKIMIDNNEIIYFTKIVKEHTDFAWIGFNLDGPAKYKLKFEINANEDLNNYNFIKIHNPIQFLKIEDKNIILNTWNSIEIYFSIKSSNDLLCFIFDNLKSLINIKFKNIFFEKI
jgi:hypothetical protein